MLCSVCVCTPPLHPAAAAAAGPKKKKTISRPFQSHGPTAHTTTTTKFSFTGVCCLSFDAGLVPFFLLFLFSQSRINGHPLKNPTPILPPLYSLPSYILDVCLLYVLYISFLILSLFFYFLFPSSHQQQQQQHNCLPFFFNVLFFHSSLAPLFIGSRCESSALCCCCSALPPLFPFIINGGNIREPRRLSYSIPGDVVARHPHTVYHSKGGWWRNGWRDITPWKNGGT